MFEMQTQYAEWNFQRGEQLHRENNWKEITGAMRIMAEWLGRDTIWANPAKVSDMVNCPACGELIMPKVTVCKHCRTVLRAMPKDLALLNRVSAEEEPIPAA
jgi:formylmethanofuran dehydrogenase subunit E